MINMWLKFGKHVMVQLEYSKYVVMQLKLGKKCGVAAVDIW